jgi:hypothetical protein
MSDSRRDFLKKSGILAAATAQQAVASAAPELPQMRLGKYSLSRLICGANTFGGGSHLSVFFNRQLRRYFTPEQIQKTLRRCQEVGINCWQSGLGSIDLYRRCTDAGLKMHYLAIDAGDDASIQKLVKGGSIGIAHHGEYTDRLFKAGKVDEMRDYLKRVRDAGVLVGISTHMPAVVDTVESKGWDVDYYMTCVYERHRTAAELKDLLGHVPLPVGEVYLQEDPPRMFRMIRQTKRPCLAFKILAAGRMSDKPEWVESAFRDTFAAIKPGDGVIIGMYDEYSDQPLENANLVRRYGVNAA